jgi:hypothetical protein
MNTPRSPTTSHTPNSNVSPRVTTRSPHITPRSPYATATRPRPHHGSSHTTSPTCHPGPPHAASGRPRSRPFRSPMSPQVPPPFTCHHMSHPCHPKYPTSPMSRHAAHIITTPPHVATCHPGLPRSPEVTPGHALSPPDHPSHPHVHLHLPDMRLCLHCAPSNPTTFTCASICLCPVCAPVCAINATLVCSTSRTPVVARHIGVTSSDVVHMSGRPSLSLRLTVPRFSRVMWWAGVSMAATLQCALGGSAAAMPGSPAGGSAAAAGAAPSLAVTLSPHDDHAALPIAISNMAKSARGTPADRTQWLLSRTRATTPPHLYTHSLAPPVHNPCPCTVAQSTARSQASPAHWRWCVCASTRTTAHLYNH